jgi:hypothetical protein
MPTDHAQVRRMLRDPQTPLTDALRELTVLADGLGATAVSAWARQELDGYSPTGPVPGYRRIAAPIVGEAIESGAPLRRDVDLADLPAAYRDEVTAAGAALALPEGVAALERLLAEGGPWTGTNAVQRRELPHLPQLLRLLPARTDQLHFVTLFWAISADHVAETLRAIRAEAETRLAAVPNPPPASAAPPPRFVKITSVTGLIIAAVGVLVAIASAFVIYYVNVVWDDGDRPVAPRSSVTAPATPPSGPVSTAPSASPGTLPPGSAPAPTP